jgi:hydroxymethylpyrimidine/phosphomethylpyrimidine kinase
MIEAQVAAVLEDLGVDAVKVGMLGSVASIEAVARALGTLPAGTPVVVDPVMVATSGARLLDPDAQAALVALVLPRATVATPNLPEARALAGDPALDGEALALAVRALGPRVVVVTGGHRAGGADLVHDGTQLVELGGERFAGGAEHGSGCTHSSALAAHLAHGWEPVEAARAARAVAATAVRQGLRELGAGPGPVDVLGVAGRAPRSTHGAIAGARKSGRGGGPLP